jgi:uncharacterized membrane protein YcaP (DUF421 family)
MELYKIAVRAVFSFAFLLLIVRISGKRTVAEGTMFDFVLALILGDMIDDALWAEVPASQFVVATASLVAAQVVTARAVFAWKRADWLVEGGSTLFMRDGELVEAGLRCEKLNEADVAHMLRENGLDREDWGDVERAWVEENGRASVIRRERAKPAQKRDAGRLGEVA